MGRSGAAQHRLVRVPLLEHTDVAVMLDNVTMYDVGLRNLGIEPSSHTDLERLFVHIISSLTSSLRLDRTLNCDVTEVQMKMKTVSSSCLMARSGCCRAVRR